jgi:hypothetical protein
VVFTGTLEQDITEEAFSFTGTSEIPVEDLPTYITTASIVSFTWSQSDPDPSTGSGTLTATADGIEFSAPMPVPTMKQKDKTDAPIPAGKGIVGFANTVSGDKEGAPVGFHLGWSGIVTLEGSLEGKDYAYDVELIYEEGDTWAYKADVFDNPDGGVDVTGGRNRFAGCQTHRPYKPRCHPPHKSIRRHRHNLCLQAIPPRSRCPTSPDENQQEHPPCRQRPYWRTQRFLFRQVSARRFYPSVSWWEPAWEH